MKKKLKGAPHDRSRAVRALRMHHVAIAVIAVLVAVALVLNYYLW